VLWLAVGAGFAGDMLRDLVVTLGPT
jgi:hypothetical protein